MMEIFSIPVLMLSTELITKPVREWQKLYLVVGMTLTAPAVCPTNGNVFIGPVSPGNPIKEYTSDFTFVGDVVGSSTGFSRTLEVSADGNTVYWTAFTNFQVLIYSRATEFDPFTLQDSTLQGFAVESATWSRDGKLLWLSAGNLLAGNNPNSYPGVTTYYSLTTWYAYNPVTKTIVDSIKWEFHPGTAIADQRPRGLAFSPDGEFAYATCFGGSTLPAIQKFKKPASSYSYKWTNLGNFPDSLLKGNSAGHGVAVDPDGKIWFGFYGATDSIFVPDSAKYVPVRVIHVFNPDGSPASFSPIKSITVGGVTDNLFNSFRGMKTDNDGNILYSSFDALYRIDYKTGEGMAKVIPKVGMTLTAPAVCPTNGNVFIGPVSPGNPIKEYTSDFTYVGDVVGSSTGFSRTLEVSADGNTVYWTAFTNFQVLIYSRATEFDPFTLQDSTLQGFAVESATWSRDGKLLWLSAGNLLAGNNPNSYPGVTTYYSLTTWYAYNPVTKTIVDSIKWEFHPGTAIADQRPRGLAFSPDGEFAYATCFGGSTLPAIQKFQRSITSVFDDYNGSKIPENFSLISELS